MYRNSSRCSPMRKKTKTIVIYEAICENESVLQ